VGGPITQFWRLAIICYAGATGGAAVHRQAGGSGSAVRLATCGLAKILVMWLQMVAGARPSRAAIAASPATPLANPPALLDVRAVFREGHRVR
jgi:hypothetical protein